MNSGQLKRDYTDLQLMQQIKDHGLSGQVFAALERNGIAISDAATRASSHFTKPEDHQLNAAFLSLYSSGKGYGDAAGIISQVAGISGPGPANMNSTFQGVGTREHVEAGVANAGVTPSEKLDNLVRNGVGGITMDSNLRPLAAVPGLTGGPSEGSIRNTAIKPFDVAQEGLFRGAAGEMKRDFNDGLPAAMGEYLGDVKGMAGDVMKQNTGAALVFGAGALGGGLYKLNEKMIADGLRAGNKNIGKFPLGDKVASGFKSVASRAFATADEAATVARGMAQGANAGRGFMVARAGLLESAGIAGGAVLGVATGAAEVAAAGYMVYEFAQDVKAMGEQGAKSGGFASADAFSSTLATGQSDTGLRALGGGSSVPGAGGNLGGHLPPAPGSTESKK